MQCRSFTFYLAWKLAKSVHFAITSYVLPLSTNHQHIQPQARIHDNTDQCRHTMFPKLIHCHLYDNRQILPVERCGIMKAYFQLWRPILLVILQCYTNCTDSYRRMIKGGALALRDFTWSSVRDGLFTFRSYISVPVKALPQALTNFQPTPRNIKERIPLL